MNRRPTIDPTLPSRNGEPVRLDCNGQPTNFTANIADENERDTLYYRFFIDYFRLEPEDILAILPGRQPPRSTGTRFAVLSPALTVNNAVLLERPTDVHVVELLVADREFDDGNPDIDPSSIGRVPMPGGLTASYSWTVYPIECD